jgi:hypothetical protein
LFKGIDVKIIVSPEDEENVNSIGQFISDNMYKLGSLITVTLFGIYINNGFESIQMPMPIPIGNMSGGYKLSNTQFYVLLTTIVSGLMTLFLNINNIIKALFVYKAKSVAIEEIKNFNNLTSGLMNNNPEIINTIKENITGSVDMYFEHLNGFNNFLTDGMNKYNGAVDSFKNTINSIPKGGAGDIINKIPNNVDKNGIMMNFLNLIKNNFNKFIDIIKTTFGNIFTTIFGSWEVLVGKKQINSQDQSNGFKHNNAGNIEIIDDGLFIKFLNMETTNEDGDNYKTTILNKFILQENKNISPLVKTELEKYNNKITKELEYLKNDLLIEEEMEKLKKLKEQYDKEFEIYIHTISDNAIKNVFDRNDIDKKIKNIENIKKILIDSYTIVFKNIKDERYKIKLKIISETVDILKYEFEENEIELLDKLTDFIDKIILIININKKNLTEGIDLYILSVKEKKIQNEDMFDNLILLFFKYTYSVERLKNILTEVKIKIFDDNTNKNNSIFIQISNYDIKINEIENDVIKHTNKLEEIKKENPLIGDSVFWERVESITKQKQKNKVLKTIMTLLTGIFVIGAISIDMINNSKKRNDTDYKYDSSGYDKEGSDTRGRDKYRYNKYGYNENGFHSGYNKNRYRSGYNSGMLYSRGYARSNRSRLQEYENTKKEYRRSIIIEANSFINGKNGFSFTDEDGIVIKNKDNFINFLNNTSLGYIPIERYYYSIGEYDPNKTKKRNIFSEKILLYFKYLLQDNDIENDLKIKFEKFENDVVKKSIITFDIGYQLSIVNIIKDIYIMYFEKYLKKLLSTTADDIGIYIENVKNHKRKYFEYFEIVNNNIKTQLKTLTNKDAKYIELKKYENELDDIFLIEFKNEIELNTTIVEYKKNIIKGLKKYKLQIIDIIDRYVKNENIDNLKEIDIILNIEMNNYFIYLKKIEIILDLLYNDIYIGDNDESNIKNVIINKFITEVYIIKKQITNFFKNYTDIVSYRSKYYKKSDIEFKKIFYDNYYSFSSIIKNPIALFYYSDTNKDTINKKYINVLELHNKYKSEMVGGGLTVKCYNISNLKQNLLSKLVKFGDSDIYDYNSNITECDIDNYNFNNNMFIINTIEKQKKTSNCDNENYTISKYDRLNCIRKTNLFRRKKSNKEITKVWASVNNELKSNNISNTPNVFQILQGSVFPTNINYQLGGSNEDELENNEFINTRNQDIKIQYTYQIIKLLKKALKYLNRNNIYVKKKTIDDIQYKINSLKESETPLSEYVENIINAGKITAIIRPEKNTINGIELKEYVNKHKYLVNNNNKTSIELNTIFIKLLQLVD